MGAISVVRTFFDTRRRDIGKGVVCRIMQKDSKHAVGGITPKYPDDGRESHKG